MYCFKIISNEWTNKINDALQVSFCYYRCHAAILAAIFQFPFGCFTNRLTGIFRLTEQSFNGEHL